MEDRNIAIITGNFGSGKTEVAITMAREKAKTGQKVVLVDLDIVNPFFRTAEVKSILEEEGIEVIVPNFATSNVDIPSLPASIYSVFNRKDTFVIFDVGGDEDGARGLGRFKEHFERCGYRMYFVINTRRPFTRTMEDILDLMERVENRSRLVITDVINNTNLSYETTLDIVMSGQEIVEEVAKKTAVPVAYISGTKKILDTASKRLPIDTLTLDLMMQPKY